MHKVLIITYYWPPSGGAGVQRWLKFVKYLRNFGWEPVVYTPLNPGFQVIDDTLTGDIPLNLEVIKRPIWEPYGVYQKISGKKGASNTSHGLMMTKKSKGFINKLSVWIRGNFFIPDARKFWIKPSVKFLVRYLRENHVDAIVSTGPPHSMHLIALEVKERLHIPWLADFRDPWTDIGYYKDLKVSAFADHRHRMRELRVIKNCNAMVVVSQEMKVKYEEMGATNVKLITNGFDPEDISIVEPETDLKFSISHIGSLPPSGNLRGLWQVLSQLADRIPGFRNDLAIKLVGAVDETVINDLSEFNLLPQYSGIDYVSHNKVGSLMKSSAVQLLVINKDSPNAKGILTGKFFEYLASGRPILAIGPTDGDLARILRELEAGDISECDDLERIEAILKGFYEKYIHNELKISTKGVERYTRKFLTSQLADVLNELIETPL